MSFTFGTPKTTGAGGGGGFPMGIPTTAQGAQAAPNTGLSFAAGDNKTLGTPQAGAKAPSFGLAYGTPPSSLGGFQLGASASTAPTLGFGANTSQNINFNMPASTAAIPGSAAPLTGFSLGSTLTQAQTSTPSLLASSLSASTIAPTLSMGSLASSTPNFNLGGTTTTTALAFPLGGISSTGLTLGTPAISSTSGGSFTLGKVSATPAIASTGLSLTATTAATALTSTTSSSAATTIPAGSFTFSQLEEALNKWTLELEDQGKMFINQALQLNAWDRLVIGNGEKILTLNNGIEKVKQQQQQLDHELDFVLAQQRELEECILPLEKELKDIPITDQDRNHTYQMAENMDTQLKQMSEDLKEIIEHLNESNKTEDTNDPVAQIGRILNAHMNSLQWIDRNTAQISTFLDQISKMHDMHRRDNERSFHLTYE